MPDLLLKNVRPIAFDNAPERADIRIDAEGRIVAVGPTLAEAGEAVDCRGAWPSPGWVDLHTPIYHGATDIPVRPGPIRPARAVPPAGDRTPTAPPPYVPARH